MIMMMMIIIIIIYSSLYVSLCTRLPVREKNTFMINSESIKAGCSLRQVPPIGHLRQVPVIGTIVKHLSGPVFRRSFHEPGHMFRPPLSLSLSKSSSLIKITINIYIYVYFQSNITGNTPYLNHKILQAVVNTTGGGRRQW